MKSSILAAALVASLGLDKKPEEVTAAINVVLASDKASKDAADKAARDKAAKDAGYDPEDMEKGEDGNWGLGAKAKDKAARDKAAKDAGCDPDKMVKGEDGNWGLGKASDEDPDIETEAEDGGVSATVGAGSIANTIAKPAQDAAIDAAVKTALAARDALYVAREDVKPLLGNVTTFDSADAVYGAALDHLKIDHKDVHPSAWRALFQAATKSAPAVVGDAKPAKTMDEAFPHLNRLRR